jgi:hypothetical protein
MKKHFFSNWNLFLWLCLVQVTFAQTGPSLTAPANGATGVLLTPTFTWNAVPNASSYTFQIADDSGFSSIVLSVDLNANTLSYTPASGILSDGRLYYWHVRVNYPTGGLWSSTWSFTTLVRPPSLSSPANGATQQALNVYLSITNNISTPGAHQVQYSTDPNFISSVSTITNNAPFGTLYIPPSTSFYASGLAKNTTYYWRSRTMFNSIWSVWTSSWSFMTGVTPGAFTLTAPTNGATNVGINPMFTWNASSGASYYRFRLSTSSTMSPRLTNDYITGTSTYTAPLSYSTTYYWQVVAYSNVDSTFSAVNSFNTGNEPVPQLTSPADGAVGLSTTPTLTWTFSLSSYAFNVQISSSNSFTAPIIDTYAYSTSYTVSPALATGTYYWRVNPALIGEPNTGAISSDATKSPQAVTAWSAVRSFTVGYPPLAAPTLVSPNNGATGVPTSPTLSWNSVSGATNYTVQLANNNSFSSPIVNQNTSSSSLVVSPALAGSTVYYWRVLASNTNTTSPWSGINNFTTGATINPNKFNVADSLALVALYVATNGANWTNKSNWLQTPVKTWFGIKSDQNRVTEINLPNNNLVNVLPNDLRDLLFLTKINFASNKLIGINNLNSIQSLFSADISGNNLQFDDLEPSASKLNSILTSVYSPQNTIGTPETRSLQPGSSTSLTCTVGGANNVYQWFKNNQPIANASSSTLNLNSVTVNDAGIYYLQTTNTSLQQLTLKCAEVTIIILAPPLAPTLISPAPNTLNASLTPTFSWNTSIGANNYKIQVSTNNAFTANVIDQTLTATSLVTPSNLARNTSYFWRVQANNTFGASAWSEVRSFTTIPNVTSAPTLINPANAAINLPLTQAFSWAQVAGSTSYRFQLSTSNTFSALTLDQNGLTNPSFNPNSGTLKVSTTYYWRVLANNAGGESPWSEVRSFTTIPNAPSSPVLGNPTNGLINVSLTPAFSWSQSAGATTYRIQIATSNTFSPASEPSSFAPILDQSGISATSFTPNAGVLSGITQYYWRMSASNAGGDSPWSEVRSFTTLPPPNAPLLIAPTNAAINQSLTPSLECELLSNATNYRFQVSTAKDFSTLIADNTGTSNKSVVAANKLDYGVLYYWRAQAINTAGASGWSTAFTFTTSPLGIPQLVAPANNATNVSRTPAFSWGQVTGAIRYQIQVSTTTVVLSQEVATTSFTPPSSFDVGTSLVWRVRAIGNASTGDWSAPFTFSTVPDLPPTITQIPSFTSAVDIGQNITISAKAKDDVGIALVTLRFHEGGQSAFTSINMPLVGNVVNGEGTYTAVVPAASVTIRGLEITIIARDTKGQESSSTRIHIPIQTTTDVVFPRANVPNGDTQNSYRLVSVPVNLQNTDVRTAFSAVLGNYDNSEWRFFEQNGSTLREMEQGSMNIISGQGYWLLARNAAQQDISLGRGTVNRITKPFARLLTSGWNFVGTPFALTLSPSGLSTRSGQSVDIQSFEGDAGWRAPTSLTPFRGYIVANNSAANDSLYVNPNAIGVATENLAKTNETQAQIDWQVGIRSQIGRLTQGETFVGVSAQSQVGFDGLDRPAPPAFGGFVQTTFDHDSWDRPIKSYRADVRPLDQDEASWQLTTRTNQNGLVTLHFDDIAKVPTEFGAWLTDDVLHITQDLRKKPEFSFVAKGELTTRRLTLTIGKQAPSSLASELPTETGLPQSFPNPFNQYVNIPYQLHEKANVSLEIFDVIGRRVAVLKSEEMQEAGFYATIWNGAAQDGSTLPSGLYLCRLQAGNQSFVQRLVLMKD